MRVEQIPTIEAKPWIMKRHYAHRMPCVQHAFGLYNGIMIEGIVSYGPPPTPAIKQAVFGGKMQEIVLELNRLCIESNNKNAASMLVGNSLKMLPKPSCVVSYADGSQGHIGYVYQSTNFVYTGAPIAHDYEYIIRGKKTHARNLTAMGISAPVEYAKKHGIEMIKPKPKHRYFYFVGSKKQKKEMLKNLKYEILPYPKGETKRYDDSAEFLKQLKLF